ncbi:MAG: AMIN-like domain-containing (lipo)protein [Pseudonocardiales bacterium]
MGTITRRAVGALATILLGAAVVTAGAIPAQAVASQNSVPTLTGIRTGVHPTFDRIVLDFSGGRPPVRSEFVDELKQDPSDRIEWLTGCAFAQVRMQGAAAHDDAGNATYLGPQKFRTRNLSNVMAVAITGDFEAVLSIGIGMRKQTSVTVFTLTGPDRVVIDVGR